ncbi:MAG TPA: alpha-hydroxy acid oxidase [Trebonia sp.]|nr:alpha-hydroxy acid oxidase [Trebonia sp.]
MKVREMRRLVRMRPVELDPTTRRLAACHSIGDLRRAARRLIPTPVFDYADGAADEEVSVRANIAAFRQWRFLPRVLADVATIDTSAAIFGVPVPLPMALAPTGYTRMLHPDGEAGAARAAARRGLPYTLSTMATTGIEELAAVLGDVPGGQAPDPWFQLYILKDRGQAHDLVDRAWEAGYRVLVVTVDTVIAGNRLKDKRNGLTMPPELSLQTVAQVASRPVYWYRLLSGPALDYANFAGRPTANLMQTAAFFDPGIHWDNIADLRSRWKGELVIKGPLGAADARQAVGLGADGIQLSNHGGRQLDRAVAPADLIAPVREAVGPSVTILVDSGIRHGADVVIALALGADAAVLGRAYLYGLMAGGEAGVDRALDLLSAQFTSTMQLLGVTSVAELRKRGRELLTRA